MRISDWSSDVCSSDLGRVDHGAQASEIGPSGMGRRPWPFAAGISAGSATGCASCAPFRGRSGDKGSRTGFGGRRLEAGGRDLGRSEEHTSELQSLMRISYAVFCLKKKKTTD